MGDAGGDRTGAAVMTVVEPSNAEVAKFGFTRSGEKHVGWFHIAVQDARPMGNGESVGEFRPNRCGVAPIEWPAEVQLVG